MLLATARKILETSAVRSSASTVQYDHAIAGAFNYAKHILQYPLKTDTSLSTTDDEQDLDLSGMSDFETFRLVDMWVDTDYKLDLWDFSLIQERRRNNATDARPVAFAWLDQTTPQLRFWGTPDDSYSLLIRYYKPLATWTYGIQDGTEDTTDLELPDEVAHLVVWYLATPLMEHANTDQAFGTQSWAKGERLIRQYKGRLSSDGALVEKPVTQYAYDT
jgi:hypothetical protein